MTRHHQLTRSASRSSTNPSHSTSTNSTSAYQHEPVRTAAPTLAWSDFKASRGPATRIWFSKSAVGFPGGFQSCFTGNFWESSVFHRNMMIYDGFTRSPHLNHVKLLLLWIHDGRTVNDFTVTNHNLSHFICGKSSHWFGKQLVILIGRPCCDPIWQ